MVSVIGFCVRFRSWDSFLESGLSVDRLLTGVALEYDQQTLSRDYCTSCVKC